MDDRCIVALYQARDEAAISETANKYGTRLKSIAFGIVEERQTAEECENDTYLEAWNSIPPQDPTNYLYAYLARIIRHIALDVCKMKGAKKRTAKVIQLTLEMEQCIPAPSDTESRVNNMELADAISRYLYTLDREKQTIFIRRYWYMDTVEAIAKKLGVSASKIKMTLLRCRNGLREYLIKEGYAL